MSAGQNVVLHAAVLGILTMPFYVIMLDFVNLCSRND